MEPDGLRWLATLGVGGALAAGMFLAYRWDFLRERRNHRTERELAKQREDRLLLVLERNAAAAERQAATNERLAQAVESLEKTVIREHRA